MPAAGFHLGLLDGDVGDGGLETLLNVLPLYSNVVTTHGLLQFHFLVDPLEAVVELGCRRDITRRGLPPLLLHLRYGILASVCLHTLADIKTRSGSRADLFGHLKRVIVGNILVDSQGLLGGALEQHGHRFELIRNVVERLPDLLFGVPAMVRGRLTSMHRILRIRVLRGLAFNYDQRVVGLLGMSLSGTDLYIVIVTGPHDVGHADSALWLRRVVAESPRADGTLPRRLLRAQPCR